MLRGNAASLMTGGEVVCINFDARLMSCNYTTALMRGGWTSRVATFIQEVNFLMKLRTDTKNLFHRRLVQCYSCSLAGLLTFMIRDVFLLEPFTCAWKCEVPQAPACIRWRENSFLPKISTFMKTWEIVFRNISFRFVWALVWLVLSSIVFSCLQSQS